MSALNLPVSSKAAKAPKSPRWLLYSALITPMFALSACKAAPVSRAPGNAAAPSFTKTQVATFNEPWAMAFLPGRNIALITEKGGTLKLHDLDSNRTATVTGTPAVDYGGQGGLGDVAVSPGYNNDSDRRIYLSWVEAGDGGTRGAVVARADLALGELDGISAALNNLTVIWRQAPKVTGHGHFSHRLAFSPDGRHLFITSGDRQKMEPAQDKAGDLGKVIRLDLATGKAEHWSMGHRNLLGLAFDGAGRLWNTEMGPQGGDELNLVKQGANYGWPVASNGSHYGGKDIPDHTPGDGFEAPKVWWNPSISPGSLMIYSGTMFAQWRGDAFIGALSGEALIRVDLDGEKATKADEWPMGTRIRAVTQGPDGAIWLLTDGEDGKLLRLAPGR